MVIRAMPSQIPKLWDAIKFAAKAATQMEGKEFEAYLVKLLAALLSDSAQCFVRTDDAKQLLALMITRLIGDEVTGKRTLFIECLYSFQRVLDKEWDEDIVVVKEFAKTNKCNYISTYSQIPRVYEIVEKLGFKERFRCFYMEV